MYFNRAYELFHEKNYNKIFIKGLGITTKSAVNISLIIMDKISNLKIKNVETSTINLLDDIINPIDKSVKYYFNLRKMKGNLKGKQISLALK